MPGAVIGIQTGYGFPGQVSRQGFPDSRTRPVNSASANILFGDPVTIGTDGSTSRATAAMTAATFAGVAMRRVKSATTYPQQANAYYAPNEPCDILEQGAISALCMVGTPTVGGTVYVRTVLNASFPTGYVGGFEAGADGSNTITLTNAKWSSGKDTNNVAELVITNRQGV